MEQSGVRKRDSPRYVLEGITIPRVGRNNSAKLVFHARNEIRVRTKTLTQALVHSVKNSGAINLPLLIFLAVLEKKTVSFLSRPLSAGVANIWEFDKDRKTYGSIRTVYSIIARGFTVNLY